MKKFTLIIPLLIIGISLYSQSCKRGENENSYNHIIKTNLLGMFTLFYEHPFTDKMTFQVGLQYNPESLPKKDMFVTSIAPEIRYYVLQNKTLPGGLFLGSYFKLQYMDVTKVDNTANIQAFAAGLNLGYQYIFKKGITTEVFAGAGYNIWKNIATDFPVDFPESDYTYDIRLGIGFGYAF